MERIEFIERCLLNTSGPLVGKPIKLANWEKDILNTLGDEFFTSQQQEIKKIIIVGKRKHGFTSFCKWLHWLKPTLENVYVITENLSLSNIIKRMPIKLGDNAVGPTEELGIKWLEPISFNKLKNNDFFKVKPDIMAELHKYDKEKIDLLYDQDPDFMTLTISSDHIFDDINEEMMEWLDSEAAKSDTIVKILKDNNTWMNYY